MLLAVIYGNESYFTCSYKSKLYNSEDKLNQQNKIPTKLYDTILVETMQT